jgi:ketosteroid isomerase-like protein
MKKAILLIIILLVSLSCNDNYQDRNAQKTEPTEKENIDYEFAKEYITKSADDWAQAIAIGDTATIARIMADDFVGVSSRGELYDKKTMIKESLESANLFSPEVYNVSIRFFGKAAVAQGNETWTQLSDSTSIKSIWTDTWIYRNGEWRIVAAQDFKYPK